MNSLACAWFLIGAFVIAGLAQTTWLATAVSRRFAWPLDGGATFRGRRVFGANKTLRGFVVMVPAAAGAFAFLAALIGNPAAAGLWPLSVPGYALLGACAGVGFMAGELPNSFIKRQLDVRPGDRAQHPLSAAVQFLIDRIDSGVGMLIAVSVVAPTPAMAWLLVLVIGPTFHWGFSVAMFYLGLKPRPA
jgi:hypothetical protein